MTSDHVASPLNQEGKADSKSEVGVTATKNKTRKEGDEKEESSTSTGSDGLKGNKIGSRSGSGSGGYNADCSSSDSSSNNDVATRTAEKQIAKLNISSGAPTSKCNEIRKNGNASKVRASPTIGSSNANKSVGIVATSQSKISGQSEGKRGSRYGHLSLYESQKSDFSENVQRQKHNEIDSAENWSDSCLPQWNGIIIEHPMDPRIDLSTVGFRIGSSHHSPFLIKKLDVKKNLSAGSNKIVETSERAEPSHQLDTSYVNEANIYPTNKSDVDSSAIPSPEQYTKLLESVRPFFCAHGITTQPNTCTARSKESQIDRNPSSDTNIAVADMLNVAKNELAVAYATAATGSREDDDNDKDSSSLVVLARLKRKRSTKQEGVESNSGRSASSSEEEARQQQYNHQIEIQQAANHENIAADENGMDHALMEDPQQQQQNLRGVQRFGFPTMVSEYSSSARHGSSEESNINMMSASGSGSGGNTASGTASGSNQGGSSGSGNDQGGMSSNCNGSSGSGNDKGSSEEMMDNAMRTNGSETSKNNDDGSLHMNINNKLGIEDNADAPRFSPDPSEPSNQRHLSSRSNDTQNQNAVREKKLQDKKRKRMNMRRVYEDQMKQDMGSSDSSTVQGLLRPGKPVTLDNAISFTKTAKLVVKSSLSLTVLYTNAAYSRLSGIDSHSAVGNPITSLLSLPRQEGSQPDYQKEDLSPNNSTIKVKQPENFESMNDHGHTTTDSKNHAAAEAAGRARAATSTDDNITDSLEKLIAANGYGKLIKINIRCKPHKMLGRNVTVFKSMVPMKRNQEEGSNGSSITSSYDGPYNFVACTMSISPVVSSPENHTNISMTNKEKKGDNHYNKAKRTEKDHEIHQQKSKRRKHHYTMNEILNNRKRQIISHYVIQLKPHEAELKKNDSERGSHTSLSTDVEARVLGLEKVEVR